MPKKKPVSKLVAKIPKKATHPLLETKVPKKPPYAGWDLFKHGVSQSLLQKFQTDVERTHIRIVRGLKETTRKEAMEYGSIFHKIDEYACTLGKKCTERSLSEIMSLYMKKVYPYAESIMLCKIAIMQYFHYLKWEESRPKYNHIEQEPIFDEKYELPPLYFKAEGIEIRIPSGVTIRLRGRIDGIIENCGMWIKENKTKSQINIIHLQDTIHANIQVMFYALCSELKYGRPCKGVVYNVIRKPGQRQKIKESDANYIERISGEIEKDPEYYFHRLTVEFAPGQVDKWVRQELLPLLYRVYIWWKSIERNPLEPWVDENGNPNPFHGRKSFGIYDPMSMGKGDFYNLIVYGRKQDLIHDPEQFPELQNDDD